METKTMKLKTGLRAGGHVYSNHNQRLAVKTGLRAGGIALNHNVSMVQPA